MDTSKGDMAQTWKATAKSECDLGCKPSDKGSGLQIPNRKMFKYREIVYANFGFNIAICRRTVMK